MICHFPQGLCQSLLGQLNLVPVSIPFKKNCIIETLSKADSGPKSGPIHTNVISLLKTIQGQGVDNFQYVLLIFLSVVVQTLTVIDTKQFRLNFRNFKDTPFWA